MQWRIQDFPEGGAPTPKVGVLTYYFAYFLSKLHQNERIRTRGSVPDAPTTPPAPSGSAKGMVEKAECPNEKLTLL